MASSPKQLRVPSRQPRRSHVERVCERRRACHPPAHPRPAEVRSAAEPHQPARHLAAFRSDREPPGRGEVERGRVSPQFADHGRKGGASYTLLHCPQRGTRVARLDMDDVGSKPRRVNPPAFEDRHPLLHPQDGLRAVDLRQEETGPAAVSGRSGEQLTERWIRRSRQTPAGLRPCLRRSTAIPPSEAGDSSAGDEGQAFRHTTHNVSVLLLFLSSESLARVNGETRAEALSP